MTLAILGAAAGPVLAQSQDFTNTINDAYTATGGQPIATPTASCAYNCDVSSPPPQVRAPNPAAVAAQQQRIMQQQMQMQMMQQGAAMIGNAIGQQLGKALFGDPQAEAAQRLAAQQAAQQAEAQRQEALRQQQLQQDAMAARLQGELMGTSGAAALSLSALAAPDGGLAPVPVSQMAYQGQDTQLNIIAAPPLPGADAKADGSASCGGELTVQVSQGTGFFGTNQVVPASITPSGPCPSAAPPVALAKAPAAPQQALQPPPAADEPALRDAVAAGPAVPTEAPAKSATAIAPLPMVATWKPVPLLRSPDNANGHPINDGTPSASCQALATQMNDTYNVARRAVLAGDAYNRYETGNKDHPERGTADTILPLGMVRVSDDPQALAALFPGTNPQTLAELLAPPDSGYRAAIYQDPADGNKLYLVFRGTSSMNPLHPDWAAANIPQQIGNGSQYFDRAIALAKLMKVRAAANNQDMEIVGHSLGGGMADAAGLVAGVKTTSFNPEGVHPSTLPPGFNLADARNFDTDYVINGEPLNWAQDHRTTVKAFYNQMVLSSAAAPEALAIPAVVKSMGDASLAPAIGKRVTLAPMPGDRSPLTLHGMLGVVDALSNQYNVLMSQYSYLGCQGPNTQLGLK
jgi:hypothetical protein